jgi:hypothetical protein
MQSMIAEIIYYIGLFVLSILVLYPNRENEEPMLENSPL